MIGGPICAGKTTVSDLILKKEKRLFRPSFDKLKVQLSDFEAEKDRALIMDLLFVLCKELVNKDISIIVEGSASIMNEMREFYTSLAKTKGYKYVEVNIEASREELLRRLAIRVAEGKSVSVNNEEQFMIRYNKYLEKRDPNCQVFSSETNTADEITDSIIQLLHQ